MLRTHQVGPHSSRAAFERINGLAESTPVDALASSCRQRTRVHLLSPKQWIPRFNAVAVIRQLWGKSGYGAHHAQDCHGVKITSTVIGLP